MNYSVGPIQPYSTLIFEVELIGIALTVILHLWRKNMMLTIAGGTIAYMILVQWIFK